MELTTFTKKVKVGDEAVGGLLVSAVADFSANTARSLQRHMGPSEIGHPCARRQAYKITGAPECNPDEDSWYSFIGSAVHDRMAMVLERENRLAGRTIWLVEQSVQVSSEISGTLDAYHVPTQALIDFKVTGPSSMREYRSADHPGDQYRTQVHGYGTGLVYGGVPVRTVSVAFLPRNDKLRNLFVWTELFNPTVAPAAINKLSAIAALARLLNVEQDPSRYASFPMHKTRNCMYCPWFQPGLDTGATCPGTSSDTV